MKLWLKLNIYSNLLLMIGLTLIIMAFCCELKWLPKTVIVLIAGGIINFSVKIFSRFEYKKNVFNKMIEKASTKYDQRFFIPYMGSPCMRNVVFFALREIGRQADYREISKRFKTERAVRSEFDLFEIEPPHVVRVSYDENGLHFERVG